MTKRGIATIRGIASAPGISALTRALRLRLAPCSTLLAVAMAIGPAVRPLPAQDSDALRDSMTVAAIAAGHAAEIMCSQVFLSGRDPLDVLHDELDGVALVPTSLLPRGTLVERQSRSAVSVSTYGEERRSVMREGLGCVPMPRHTTLADTVSLPSVHLPALEGDAARIAWPDGDLLPRGPLPAEVDRDKLDEVVEGAFTAEKYQPSVTTGVVVLYQGRIIAERYRPGWDMHTAYRAWSASKSISNALVGVMVGRGKLAVDEPAPIPEWRDPDDPRGEITLEHLLHMSSGLENDGGGEEYLSPTNLTYWGGIDTDEYIRNLSLEVEPYSRWQYSNFDAMLVLSSVRAVLPDDDTYLRFPYESLYHKIGMRHTVMEPDPYGNYLGSSQIYTTARDLARLGLLFQQDGMWNGERILPAGWTQYSAQPATTLEVTPGRGARGYGAGWWLWGEDPRLPAGTYSANGARGQYVTIVPSRNLVVVRRGLDQVRFRGPGNFDPVEFVAEVLGAISSRSESN